MRSQFLDNKILLGCTNRGGLSGSFYEMYDHVTAYNIEDIRNLGLDGAKMMVRLDLERKMAKYSQKTLEICSKMIRHCNELIKTMGVATALGGSSLNIWLKIPYVDNYESIVRSTSNPILILGGESTGNPIEILKDFEKGCLAGRNLLYPGYDDPRDVVLEVSNLIHDYTNNEDAIKIISPNRGKEMDFLTSKII